MAEPLNTSPTIDMPPIDIEAPSVKELDGKIDVGQSVSQTSRPAAERRAAKASIGFPQLNIDPDSLADDIERGNEMPIRKTLASMVDNNKEKTRIAEVTRVANKPDRTKEDDSYIKSLTGELPRTNPLSVLEEQYSLEYANKLRDLSTTNPDSAWNQLDAAQTAQTVFGTSLLMTKSQVIRQHLEEAQQAVEKQTGFQQFGNTLQDWIPFYWQWKLLGRTPHGLVGSELEKDSKRWFDPSMTQEQFMDEFPLEAQRRIQENPGSAVEWLTSMLGESSSDRTMKDLFAVADLPSVFGVAKGAAKAGKAWLGVKRLIETELREAPTKAALEEAVGATEQAAATQFAEETITGIKGRSNPLKETIDNFPALINGPSEALKGDPGRFRREWVERLYDKSASYGKQFMDAVTNAIRVERLPAINRVTAAVRDLMEGMKREYPRLENTIFQMDITPHPVLNAHNVDFFVGPDAKLMDKAEDAAAFVKNLGLEKISKVEPIGDKFAVKISYPLSEVEPWVKDMLVPTTGANPGNMLTKFIANLSKGYVITPEETLSTEHLLQRKAAVFGPQAFLKVYKNTLKDFNKLRHWGTIPGLPARDQWKELDKVLRTASSTRDGAGKMGVRFHNIPELDDFWQKVHGTDHLPSERQVEAYFSHKRADELFEQFVAINDLKMKHREGVQLHTIDLVGEQKNYKTEPSFYKRIKFEAAKINHLPTGEFSTVMFGRTAKDIDVFQTSVKYRGAVRDAIIKDLLEGKATAYRLHNPESQPLAKYDERLANEHPHYVITYQAVKPEPVPFNVRTERPPAYDYPHAVKQAIVSRDPATGLALYKGDRTIAVHNVGAATRGIADSLNKVRAAMNIGDEDLARAIHGREGLPQSFESIRDNFKNGKWSLADPITAAPRGKMLININNDLSTRYGDKLRDLAQRGYHNEVGWKYDPDNIFTMRNEGTVANPDWKEAPVKYLDPATTLNRAIKRIIGSSFLDDYRIYAIQHWIGEAGPLFDAKKVSQEQLLASPAYYFHNADRFLKEGADPDWKTKLQGLRTSRLQINQLLGYGSATDRLVYRIQQKLQDFTYNAKPILGEYAASKIINPIDFARAMTFHFKIGLFNISQIVVQANTFATIFAVAGLRPAMKGTAAATLYGWAKINRNPAIWAHMDKLAEGMGWKPGEWTEATKIGEAGFFHVANEVAFRDGGPWTNNVITTPVQKVLDWGTGFFRGGEAAPRISALYTAYHEARVIKPTGAFSNAERQGILNRADVLTNNMSRASVANMQHGVFAPMLQFKSWHIRMAELAMGSRLTPLEKTRLWVTYAGLYGIGVFGLTGVPVEDWLREYQVNRGYNVGEKWMQTLINEGIPSIALQSVTGENYNFQARFGVQSPAQDLIKALHSDKTFMDILGGASGNTVADSIAAMHPFWMAAKDWIRGEGAFKFKMDDLWSPLEPIASAAHTRQFLQMLSTGRQIDRHAATTQGFDKAVTTPQAFLQYMSGLSPQKIADTYLKFNIGKEYGKDFKVAEQHAKEWIRKGNESVRDSNYSQFEDYWKRAWKELDDVNFPQHEYSRVLSEAMKDWEDVVQKGDWEHAYGRKNVPSGDIQRQRQEAYQRNLMRQK